MTDMYSLEPRQVLISQWGSPATIIGNQNVLKSNKLALLCSAPADIPAT